MVPSAPTRTGAGPRTNCLPLTRALIPPTAFLRRGLAHLRARMGTSPSLFFFLYGLRAKTRRLRTRRDSSIVIEGFPRSANSFAVLAFARAQEATAADLRIAHHLHVPAQVLRAIRWGIPTVVLVRDPLDAVTSLLIREPWRSMDGAFADYCSFYRTVLQCPGGGYVVGTFSEVTGHFGSVIERVNQRFETRFRPFAHTPAEVRAVFAELEELERADHQVKELEVARPSTERDRLKNELRERLERDADSSLVEEAIELCRALRNRT